MEEYDFHIIETRAVLKHPKLLKTVKEEGLTRALKNYMVSDPQYYIDTKPTGERHLT